MQRQHLAQHLALAHQPRAVEPGADAGAVVDAQPTQSRQQQRGRRAVADAHLAQQQGIAGQRPHHVAAVRDGLGALLGGHGRAGRGVGRARGYPARDQAGPGREAAPHTAVDHSQRQAVLARQHAHRRAAGQEVLDHLPGHIARVSRDAARRQPVVARAHQHLRCLELRQLAAQDQSDAQGQRLQPAQRAERLGLVVERALQAHRQRGVGQVGDVGDQLVVVVHAISPANTPASKWESMKSARPSKVASSVGAEAPNNA